MGTTQVQDTRRASSMVRGAGCREINLRIRRREKNVLDILFYRSRAYTNPGPRVRPPISVNPRNALRSQAHAHARCSRARPHRREGAFCRPYTLPPIWLILDFPRPAISNSALRRAAFWLIIASPASSGGFLERSLALSLLLRQMSMLRCRHEHSSPAETVTIFHKHRLT